MQVKAQHIGFISLSALLSSPPFWLCVASLSLSLSLSLSGCFSFYVRSHQSLPLLESTCACVAQNTQHKHTHTNTHQHINAQKQHSFGALFFLLLLKPSFFYNNFCSLFFIFYFVVLITFLLISCALSYTFSISSLNIVFLPFYESFSTQIFLFCFNTEFNSSFFFFSQHFLSRILSSLLSTRHSSCFE